MTRLKHIHKEITALYQELQQDFNNNEHFVNNPKTIRSFLSAFRVYTHFGVVFTHPQIMTIIKQQFNIKPLDQKKANLLKVKSGRFIDNLIETKYVTKSKSKEDKRKSIFTFTEEAIKLFNKYDI